MSKQGIKLAAEAFSELQRLSHKLVKLGTSDAKTESGKQDIILGQMLKVGKDAMKDSFAKITLGTEPSDD